MVRFHLEFRNKPSGLVVAIFREGVEVMETTRSIAHGLLTKFYKAEPALDTQGTPHLWVRE